VREHMVAHGPTGIKGVYNRYAYDKEKRRGFELYEAALQQVINLPETVIPMAPGRRATAAVGD
jgi:hypothetical protein